MDKRPEENYGLPGLPTEIEYLRADRKWLAAELAISKGREEAKQLVINQLEAALRAVMAANFSQDSTYKIAERALITPERDSQPRTQASEDCEHNRDERA